MPNDEKQWVIETDKVHFTKLKSEKWFQQTVALSRAVNTLRFVQIAMLAHSPEDDSLHASRTRINSFFFTCALLYEALLLVQRMCEHCRDLPAFAQLHAILKDRTAIEI